MIKLVKESIEIDNKKREELASNEHNRWAGWMKYLFTKGKKNDDGSFTINKESVNRWERQMKTNYKNLSQKEKDSDRKEADKTIKIVEK